MMSSVFWFVYLIFFSKLFDCSGGKQKSAAFANALIVWPSEFSRKLDIRKEGVAGITVSPLLKYGAYTVR